MRYQVRVHVKVLDVHIINKENDHFSCKSPAAPSSLILRLFAAFPQHGKLYSTRMWDDLNNRSREQKGALCYIYQDSINTIFSICLLYFRLLAVVDEERIYQSQVLAGWKLWGLYGLVLEPIRGRLA